MFWKLRPEMGFQSLLWPLKHWGPVLVFRPQLRHLHNLLCSSRSSNTLPPARLRELQPVSSRPVAFSSLLPRARVRLEKLPEARQSPACLNTADWQGHFLRSIGFHDPVFTWFLSCIWLLLLAPSLKSNTLGSVVVSIAG